MEHKVMSDYIASINMIFDAAMKKGDLRTALQAKVIEGKCIGMLKNGTEKVMFNTNLSSMPISVLKQILADTK